MYKKDVRCWLVDSLQ